MSETADRVEPFHFNISLTVLEHLGRNLYRNFSTVLGEAISNAWDADANIVDIKIDREENSFSITDNGIGMDERDFQEKFLKIGYTKRAGGSARSPKGRPYIGRKGIGKLALLSCCDELHIITKAAEHKSIGGIINNASLDNAIENDEPSQNYSLNDIEKSPYRAALDKQKSGTFLVFQGMKKGIPNTVEYIRKIIALSFHFSLIDPEFQIIVNGAPVTESDLSPLAEETQFMWGINDIRDDAFTQKISKAGKHKGNIPVASDTDAGHINGFIATVIEPKHIKIRGTDEKVSIDLFVNGRLREKDILRHFDLTGIVKNYMYGQINCDALDDDKDRFTSSREGVIEGDPIFTEMQKLLAPVIKEIRRQWDGLRSEKGQEGDSELDEGNVRKTLKRRSKLLYSAGTDYMSTQFKDNEDADNFSDGRVFFDESAKKHTADGQNNIEAYTLCYLCENSVRDYINAKSIPYKGVMFGKRKTLSKIAGDYKTKERVSVSKMTTRIPIKLKSDDLGYLDMCHLTRAIESHNPALTLQKGYDGFGWSPIRNSVMHTCAITPDAKEKLFACFGFIKYILK